MHQTLSPVTDNGNGTLNFTGWGVNWNGIGNIPLGGDPANYSSDTGLATINCSDNLCSGYILDYNAHVPIGDPSGFGGVWYVLHLEGSDPSAPSISIVVPGGNTQECAETGGSSVSMSANVTVPNGDAVSTITWSVDGSVLGTGTSIVPFLDLGSHVISANVLTFGGLRASSTSNVGVEDTTPPVAHAAFVNKRTGAEITSVSGKVRIKIQATATDICDANPVVNAMMGAPVNDGDSVGVGKSGEDLTISVSSIDLAVQASDASGNTATDTATLNTAP